MTGERKSSGKLQSSIQVDDIAEPALICLDSTRRLGRKRSAGKLVSKSSKPSSSTTVVTPPKAAVAAPNEKKEEVHRRRNPFNDLLRNKSTSAIEVAKHGGPLVPESHELPHATQPAPAQPNETGLDVRMARRVVDLERALAVAREEQHVLAEELSKARKQGQADQNTMEEWSQQLPEAHGHSAPSRASSNSDTRQLSGQQDIAELNDLKMRLHESEKESQERLQQLLSLKLSISSLTRANSQVTDSEIIESFTQLANRVQELGLCQAVVSQALVQILEEPLIVGLPLTGPLAAIRQCAKVIHSTGLEYSEWRRATIRAVGTSTARHELLKGTDDLLHRIAGDVAHLLFTLTSIPLTLGARSALMGILGDATELQRTFALQKANLQVHFFSRGRGTLQFHQRTMESVYDLDDAMDEGDALTERMFLFCIFPCLEKYGDERGEHQETSHVLVKARVCCGVG
ncbi:hypothetical protein BDW02DRAFT_494663 [Decorospora gaudefroyi]|uniref:Uncharacterized protein n=1 Tax=Decorospora gaudefroyi TaxID=184978 RepID=A0A6A5KFV5_9PLEO|nr:hypothetical protein BDW02DRAFT_494663 [Decorospora gaudefroyi]